MFNLPHTFGNYELLEKLGEGGMGIVYRAHEASLRRYVALKVMRQELRAEPQFVERFHREARLAASLDHPNIVAVHAVGEEQGHPYFTMQMVDGDCLVDRMDGRPMPLPDVIRVLEPVAEALECAHRSDIVHRDVKPLNILIDREGRIRVTDFGIARALRGSMYTSTGRLIGTPEYMSPEQAEDSSERPIDARSDVYSLGVVLFQMVTGNVPFRATSPVATALRHVKDPPPRPRQLRPDLPVAVERVILKALEKDPQRRYQRPAEITRDLRAAIAEQERMEQSQRVEHGQSRVRKDLALDWLAILREHWRLVAAGLAILFVLSILAFGRRARNVPPPPPGNGGRPPSVAPSPGDKEKSEETPPDTGGDSKAGEESPDREARDLLDSQSGSGESSESGSGGTATEGESGSPAPPPPGPGAG